MTQFTFVCMDWGENKHAERGSHCGVIELGPEEAVRTRGLTCGGRNIKTLGKYYKQSA